MGKVTTATAYSVDGYAVTVGNVVENGADFHRVTVEVLDTGEVFQRLYHASVTDQKTAAADLLYIVRNDDVHGAPLSDPTEE